MNKKIKILITGAAGFIGHALCNQLLQNEDYEIIGIDSLNDYYSIQLKASKIRYFM